MSDTEKASDVGSLYVNKSYAWLVLHEERRNGAWRVTYAFWNTYNKKRARFDTIENIVMYVIDSCAKEDGHFEWDVNETHVSSKKKESTC
jgi:hypothetical protein